MAVIAMLVAIILFLLGLAGIVLPGLPGVPLIWLGMFAYGVLTGFSRLGLAFYVWQGIAVGIALVIDYAAAGFAARRFGGSSAAMWGAGVGLVLGPFVLGPVGIVIGPFAGAFLGQLLRGGTPVGAVRVAFGTLVGLVGATLLKLALGVGMIVAFFWSIAS